MSAVTIHQMADRVALLLEERLGIRGTGLAAKLRRAGRRLPRKVRIAGQNLARADEMAKTPKLLLQVDLGRVSQDYDTCARYLSGIDRRSRRMGALAGFGASVGFGLLVLAGAVLAVLRWRGYI